jgi:hypothetical protein
MQVRDEAAARQIQELGIGIWAFQCLYSVTKLGVPDSLSAGPKSAEELARDVGAHPETLLRVLRYLSSLGVFEMKGERFNLNPVSRRLLDTPGSQRDFVILFGEEFYEAWGRILHTVKTGEDAFRHTFGRGLFEYLQANPDYARTFDRAMAAGSAFFEETPDLYDFSPYRVVVDVGGGNGALLTAILTRHSHLRGVLFDSPSVVQAAKANLQARGVGERCQVVAGDFFLGLPEGDVYLFSRILHDWDDDQCLTILKNCRAAMAQSGRVLIIERLIPGPYAMASDVNMLAVTGGKERSEDEFRKLLAASGFELGKVIPLPLEANIVEAVPK